MAELFQEFNLALIGLMIAGISLTGKTIDLAWDAIKKRQSNGKPDAQEVYRSGMTESIQRIEDVLINGKDGNPSIVTQVQLNTRLLTDHLSEHRQT